jgi:hypothetical protein
MEGDRPPHHDADLGMGLNEFVQSVARRTGWRFHSQCFELLADASKGSGGVFRSTGAAGSTGFRHPPLMRMKSPGSELRHGIGPRRELIKPKTARQGQAIPTDLSPPVLTFLSKARFLKRGA